MNIHDMDYNNDGSETWASHTIPVRSYNNNNNVSVSNSIIRNKNNVQVTPMLLSSKAIYKLNTDAASNY